MRFAVFGLAVLSGCAGPHYLPEGEHTFFTNKAVLQEDGTAKPDRVVYPIHTYRGLPSLDDPNAPDADGFTPLFAAVFGRDVQAIRRLLLQGADPDRPITTAPGVRLRGAVSKSRMNLDVQGWTPLHLAALVGDEATIEELLRGGGNPHARTRDGRTPLMTAWEEWWEEQASPLETRLALFLKRGADPNATDPAGNTPLDYAAGYPEGSQRVLLDAGAHPSLFYLADRGEWKEVFELLRGGVDVHRRGSFGWTLLHHAAYAGDADVARKLVEFGAEVNARTRRGETPLAVARHDGAELKSYLESVGGTK